MVNVPFGATAMPTASRGPDGTSGVVLRGQRRDVRAGRRQDAALDAPDGHEQDARAVGHDLELPVLGPDVGGDALGRVGRRARDVEDDLVGDDVGRRARHEAPGSTSKKSGSLNRRSCRSLSSASVQRTWRTATAASGPMVSREGRLVGGRVIGHEHGHDAAAAPGRCTGRRPRPGARRGTPGRRRRGRPPRSGGAPARPPRRAAAGRPSPVDASGLAATAWTQARSARRPISSRKAMAATRSGAGVASAGGAALGTGEAGSGTVDEPGAPAHPSRRMVSSPSTVARAVWVDVMRR